MTTTGFNFGFPDPVAGGPATPYVSGARTAALPNGEYVVVWQQWRVQDSTLEGYDFYARRFDGNGSPAQNAVSLGIFSINGASRVVGLANGGYVVLAGTSSGVVGQVFANNGSPVGSSFTSTFANFDVNVAALQNGGFVVTYSSSETSGHNVYAQTYSAAGVANGPAARVNGTNLNSSVDAGTSVAGLADGGYLVVWHSTDGGGRVFAQRYDASSARVGAQFEVAAGYESLTAVVALDNGGFVIGWSDSVARSQVQVFNAAGQRVGGAFEVDGTLVGALPGAGFAAAGIGIQLFNSDGTARSADVQPPSNYSIYSPPTVLTSGNMVFADAGVTVVRATDVTLTPGLPDPTDVPLSLTAISTSVGHNRSIALASLVDVRDPTGTGDRVVEYRITNTLAGDGVFIIDGVAVAATQGQTITLTAAQLEHASFRAGSEAEDNLLIQAFDNDGQGSNAAQANLRVFTPVYPPNLVVGNQRLTSGQEVAASAFFGTNGGTADRVRFTQTSDGADSARLLQNGLVPAPSFEVSYDELEQLSIRGGSAATTFTVSLFDGTTWSTPQSFTVSPERAPTLAVSDTSLRVGATAAFSSFVIYSDADGDGARRYRVTNNGTVALTSSTQSVGAGQTVELDAASFANLSLTMGAQSASFTVSAYDGYLWSAAQTFTVQPLSTFSRSVQVVDLTGINGGSVSLLQANALAALDSWARYLTGRGSIDVRIEIDGTVPSGILAYGGPVWVVPVDGSISQAGTIYELQTGVDPNGAGFDTTTADIVISVNSSLLRDGAIWLDPTAGVGGFNGRSDQYDLLTILRHEIGHGLGFIGGIDDPTLRLTYDTNVSFNGGVPYYVGSTAVTVNHGPVRLASGDVSHVSELALTDLMNPTLAPGTRQDVSAVDAAILHDLGIAFAPYALAPMVSAADNSFHQGAVVAASSLFSVRDLDGDSVVSYIFYDDTAGGGGWLLNGTLQAAQQNIHVSASQLSTVQYRAGAGSDHLYVRAYDGANWSEWGNFWVSGVNLAPLLTTSNNSVHGVQTLAAAALFSASDPEGNPIVAYQFGDSDRSTSSGSFLLNGVAQPAGVEWELPASQLANLAFRTGASGTERLWVRASDGMSWSAWREVTVTSTNAAPQVTTTNRTVHGVQTLAASSLFSATDADGDAVVAYQLGDSDRSAESGSFLLNGVAQPAGVEWELSAAQLANLSFRTGASGSERLWVRASDGSSWGEWRQVTVASANTAPQVTTTNATVHGIQTLAASSLFSATDADGDAVVAYQLGDSDRSAASGSFLLNGVAQPAGVEWELSAAQLANLSFRTGASGSERLWVRASDGSSWGEWRQVTVTSANAAPQVTAINATVHGVQTLAASSLFRANDADGDAIVAYQFGDSERAATSGSFLLNGVAQPAGTEFEVSAAQLANLSFRTGASGSERLWVRASDGSSWGEWRQVTVTSANAAPLVTPIDRTVFAGTPIAASTLFSTTDADGDAIVAYQFGDSERAATSGSFELNGVAQPAGVEWELSAAQLSSLTFRAGAADTTERLWVRASDGSSWSDWRQVNVTAIEDTGGAGGSWSWWTGASSTIDIAPFPIVDLDTPTEDPFVSNAADQLANLSALPGSNGSLAANLAGTTSGLRGATWDTFGIPMVDLNRAA